MEEEKKTNVMAILGLVFSILFPPLGLIFSIIALNQIKKDPSQGGKGLAMTGLILSIILLIIMLIVFIVLFMGVLSYVGN